MLPALSEHSHAVPLLTTEVFLVLATYPHFLTQTLTSASLKVAPKVNMVSITHRRHGNADCSALTQPI